MRTEHPRACRKRPRTLSLRARTRALALGLAAMLGVAAVPAEPRAQPLPTGSSFPSTVTTITGESIDVAELAREDNLVVITLKATWCQVCQRQLVRVRERLDELEACDATFLVLAPGPADELAEIRERTGFTFPFIEDRGLEIAASLGLARAREQILPCMFEVGPDLEIGWRQMGRNGAYFGDAELRDFFDCVSI